ncbi:hypothetical protein FNV43_RR01598 [Rhamnella rubrinervis]|uniref:Uncharacterized protein n=1 Tax=Rhamnella rubrinervis TaxID=2594499 RepID=A0A8K0HSS0_9ROSA|nr:hypothetical protein FNV43_RR01598 [Rhamnella rubrinervis]
MAGTLPGVGVSSRRKLKPNHPSFTSNKEWMFKPSMSTANNTTAMDLDETALRARQRLEKKLGYSPPSSSRSSSSNNQHRTTQRILVWLQSYISCAYQPTAKKQRQKDYLLDKITDRKGCAVAHSASPCCTTPLIHSL